MFAMPGFIRSFVLTICYFYARLWQKNGRWLNRKKCVTNFSGNSVEFLTSNIFFIIANNQRLEMWWNRRVLATTNAFHSIFWLSFFALLLISSLRAHFPTPCSTHCRHWFLQFWTKTFTNQKPWKPDPIYTGSLGTRWTIQNTAFSCMSQSEF